MECCFPEWEGLNFSRYQNWASLRAISMSGICSSTSGGIDLLFYIEERRRLFTLPPGQEFVYKQLKEWVEVWLPVSLVGLAVTLFAIHSMIEDSVIWPTKTQPAAEWGKWQQRYVNTLDRLDLFLWIPTGYLTFSQNFDSSHIRLDSFSIT